MVAVRYWLEMCVFVGVSELRDDVESTEQSTIQGNVETGGLQQSALLHHDALRTLHSKPSVGWPAMSSMPPGCSCGACHLDIRVRWPCRTAPCGPTSEASEGAPWQPFLSYFGSSHYTSQSSQCDDDRRHGALLVVRYCSLKRDPKASTAQICVLVLLFHPVIFM